MLAIVLFLGFVMTIYSLYRVQMAVVELFMNNHEVWGTIGALMFAYLLISFAQG